LGHAVERLTVHPQKGAIRRDSLTTVNDFQKLLGDINWFHPSLGIPNYKLNNLFSILEGDTSLDSPRTLTSAAENELQFFGSRLWTAFLTKFDPFFLVNISFSTFSYRNFSPRELSFKMVIFKTKRS
jgi:hypothetical protein